MCHKLKKNRGFTVLFFLLGFYVLVPGYLPGNVKEENARVKELITRVKNVVPGLIKQEEIPGLSLGIVVDGRFHWAGGFGVKNAKTREPAQPNSIYEACSLSKCVFAYGVLKLVQEGKLDLDKSLLDYVPVSYIEENFLKGKLTDNRIRKITARMVLSHQTGFPNWRRKKKISLLFTPGEKFSYSGEGFCYLQAVVEKIIGKSLDEFMMEYVFQPLGMTNSSYSWQVRFEKHMSFPHSAFGTPQEMSKEKKGNAAASLYTTAPDYATFVAAVLTGKGLTGDIHNHLLQPQVTTHYHKEGKVTWGLGVSIQKLKQGVSVWHWGDNGQYKCFFVGFPGENTGLVFFTNSYNGLNIVEKLVTTVMGGEHPIIEVGFFRNYGGDRQKLHKLVKDKNTSAAEVIAFFRQMQEKEQFLKKKKLGPGMVDLFKDAANWQFRAGRHTDALGLLKFLTRDYPHLAAAHNALGDGYIRTGNQKEALKCFQKALIADPENKHAQEQIKRLEKNKN